MFLRIYIPRTKRVFQVCLHQKEFFEQNNFLINIIKKKVSKSRIDLVKSKANFMKFQDAIFKKVEQLKVNRLG